jgi:hypothetical protein
MRVDVAGIQRRQQYVGYVASLEGILAIGHWQLRKEEQGRGMF